MKQLSNKVPKIARKAPTGGCPRWGPSSVACELCDRPGSSASPVLSNPRDQSAPSSPRCSCCENSDGSQKTPRMATGLRKCPGSVATSTVPAQLRVSHRTQEGREVRQVSCPSHAPAERRAGRIADVHAWLRTHYRAPHLGPELTFLPCGCASRPPAPQGSEHVRT